MKRFLLPAIAVIVLISTVIFIPLGIENVQQNRTLESTGESAFLEESEYSLSDSSTEQSEAGESSSEALSSTEQEVPFSSEETGPAPQTGPSVPNRGRSEQQPGPSAAAPAPQTENPAPPASRPEPSQPAVQAPSSSQAPVKPVVPAPESSRPTSSKPETGSGNTSYIEQVVKLVNQERAKEGLGALAVSQPAEAAALVRAKEIESSFSHTRPNGSSFSTALSEQGARYRSSGENIAWGQKSPEQVMEGWMNSPGHRANILNSKFTAIGVGYYRSAAGVNYWTQLFIG